MDVYRKERSSRQHMKVDLHNQDSQQQDGGLLLANPMAGMDISPSPGNHGSASGNGVSMNSTSTSPGHGSQSLHSAGGIGGPSLSRASNERSSFKNKSRPKSPSLFRFFVRGHSAGGGGRKVSYDVDEEDYGADASSGSEHEDPFSPRGITTTGDLITNRHTTDVPKSPNGSLQRQYKRQHNSSTGHAQRDSGFSSERESISHLKEDKDSHLYHNMDDLSGGSTDEYHPAGMDALEVLQNQLQLLVKQDCDDVDTDSVSMYEQVVAGLSRQVEDHSNSLDCLRQSDHNLRLSLRLAEQRALEAEIKLGLAMDRSQRAEQKCLKLAFKYRGLAKKYRELEKFQQKKAILHQMELATPSPKPSPLPQQRTISGRSPPQRVQSQTQYDRNNPSDNLPTKRPSTVQGFHSGEPMTITSLSHIETRV